MFPDVSFIRREIIEKGCGKAHMTEPLIGQAGPATGLTHGALIKDSDIAHFQTDVLDASGQVPVLVDFWAPWCGPCKTLGPALEKIVRASAGQVKLVKIDIDQNAELAQHMGIQSIPAVFAFRDGKPVDGFLGAQSESQVRQFVDRIVAMGGGMGGSPIAEDLAAAKTAFDAGNYQEAAGIYHQVYEAEPTNAEAISGLIRALVNSGHAEDARYFLEAVPAEQRDHPDIAAAVAAIEMAERGAEAGDVSELARRVGEQPGDHEARLALAMALFGAGKHEEAIAQLLESIRRDRKWNDEAARQQLLKCFEALGLDHPVSMDGRRRLSSILFS